MAVAESQIRAWLPALSRPTVLAVEEPDAFGAFKRAFASTLLLKRVESGEPNQGAVASKVPTSTATYARWEDPTKVHLPDAWEIARLCEILNCEPEDFIAPPKLTDREVQVLRRSGRAAKRGARRALEDDSAPDEPRP